MFLVKRPLNHTFCLARVPEIVLVVQIAGNISRIAVTIEYKVVASSGGFQSIPEIRSGRSDDATSLSRPVCRSEKTHRLSELISREPLG